MNKTLLVTGASTGLGAATAVHLARDNRVLVHYNRSESAAQDVAAEVEKAGGKAILLQADLTTDNGCIALSESVMSKSNHLDVLVNNAGGGVSRYGVGEITWELLEKIFALNTFSVMRTTALLIPLLRKGTGPCVVNISSVAARSGAPSASIYGAAKGAIDTYTRGAAKELAPDIRVNSVAPGVFETPFHAEMTAKEKLAALAENTPLKRNGDPVNIAQAVRFLIENDFITGECIDVNGGLSMR